MFSIREIIDIAIKIEKNGESFYREALEKVSNPALKPVLLFLADQEHDHVQWFEKLKHKLKTAGGEQKVTEIGEAMLQNLIGDQTFSLDDADLSELDTVEGLIELAIELEKDTILFYQMLQAFIEDSDTLEELNEIIAEESRHIEILREYEG
jgi:rubrerythrin